MRWASRLPGARQASYFRWLYRLREHLLIEEAGHSPRPPDHGFVLEVGAEQSPQRRTDVVVEKYPFDDHERPGDAPFSFVRPFVVGDGEHLPFADRTFSYVICIHVLEHALDPVQFGRELARVAGAGFVQVPTRLSELTFGWPFHPWLIDRTDDGLAFESKEGRKAPMGQMFHDLWADDELFRLWFSARRSLWHQSVAWRGSLSIEVRGTAGKLSSAAVDVPLIVKRLGAVSTVQSLPQLPDDIRSALRCPHCAGELSMDAEHLVCVGCSARYPAPGGVPVLLLEAAG